MKHLLIAPLALATVLAACDPPATSNVADTNTADVIVPETENAVAPTPDASAITAAPSPSTSPSAVDTAWTQDRYIGRWKGVEGMFLNVTAKSGGGVKMEMQYDLDHKQTTDGSVTAEGLRFMRDGKALVASPSDGDATGLKWLAGKKDCLTVAEGEGYCRD